MLVTLPAEKSATPPAWYKSNFAWPIFAAISFSSLPADLMTIAGADATWPTAGKAGDGKKNLFKFAVMLGYSLAKVYLRAEILRHLMTGDALSFLAGCKLPPCCLT